MFAAGIITGEVSGVSCVLHETGAGIALWATPVLLALTAMVPTIRQRHATTATAMLLTAVFATGILRTNTGGSGTEKRAERTGTMEYVARHADTQRAKLKGIYKEIGLRGDEYAIVVAMTLGEKEDTSQRLKEAYRNSGAAHIFALSGMHMSILFFFLCCIIPYRKHPPHISRGADSGNMGLCDAGRGTPLGGEGGDNAEHIHSVDCSGQTKRQQNSIACNGISDIDRKTGVAV